MFDPVPGILFRTAAVATPLGVSGGLLVARWMERRRREKDKRTRRAYLAIGVALLLFAGAVIVAGAYDVVCVRTEERRFTFDYRAFLAPNGTGVARVSLPMPVDEVLIGGLTTEPSSSATAVNRSGAEPALDVTLSGPTWVNASFTVILAPGESYPANLTRVTDGLPFPCGGGCAAELATNVLSGDVRDVLVTLSAVWRRPCSSMFWTIDAVVLPGVATYPGSSAWMVC